MKEYIVVGFRPYSGTFEGINYSGNYCHCISLVDPSEGFSGRYVKELKIKGKFNYSPRVGDIIQVGYGESGIESVDVVNHVLTYDFD